MKTAILILSILLLGSQTLASGGTFRAVSISAKAETEIAINATLAAKEYNVSVKGLGTVESLQSLFRRYTAALATIISKNRTDIHQRFSVIYEVPEHAKLTTEKDIRRALTERKGSTEFRGQQDVFSATTIPTQVRQGRYETRSAGTSGRSLEAQQQGTKFSEVPGHPDMVRLDFAGTESDLLAITAKLQKEELGSARFVGADFQGELKEVRLIIDDTLPAFSAGSLYRITKEAPPRIDPSATGGTPTSHVKR